MKKENAKLQADYKTDTVFSQASFDRAFSEVEALGSLPKGMKKTLAEEIFLDMNESLNEGERLKHQDSKKRFEMLYAICKAF